MGGLRDGAVVGGGVWMEQRVEQWADLGME